MKTNYRELKSISFLLIVFAIMSFQSVNDSYNSPGSSDSFSLTAGKLVFISKCAGCHGSKGQGDYGPNLCDNYWIHGGHYQNIAHIIKHGVSSKGMTSFRHELTHSQIRNVAHYVLISLKCSNPSNAKKPQGKLRHN